MSNGNGEGAGGGEKKVLMCPFFGEWCIGERCALYEKLVRVMGGMKQEVGVCGFVAGNAILSEINTALHQQPRGSVVPKIVIPRG